MRQALQLLEGAGGGGATAAAARLPVAATANDLRGLVQYLKNRPAGVTLGEAIGGMKKQAFEQRKLSSYEALGLTVRSGDRLKLSALGRELARCLEPETAIFRRLLDNFPPYRAVLAWAADAELDVLVQTEVEDLWRRDYLEALGPCTERTAEGSVVCFFQLCQAAGMGTHILGKKGQPTRLRLDREELSAYLHRQPASRARDEELAEEGTPKMRRTAALRSERTQPETTETKGGPAQVFISHRRGTAISARVREALQLADLESCAVARQEEPGDLPVDAGLRAGLRQCQAAIIIIHREDYRRGCDGTDALREEVQTEIGAAFVLYDGRLLLLRERALALPANLAGLSHCLYEDDRLSWEAAVELVRTIKAFRLSPS